MERGQLSQHAVILRGAQIADATGFDSVSLAEVARSFGVRTPSLYGHVRDLAALRDGITVLALGELSARIGEAIAGRSNREALAGFIDAHRTYAAEHPGRWESLQRRAGAEAVNAPEARKVVQATDAVLHGYGITGDARTHAIRIVGAAISGFLNLERVGSFAHSSPGTERSWEELTGSLHFLLVHWHRREEPLKEDPA
ncbi:TetR/AcrR family transcriptional regulator [Amycolatopsis magusensis]|uniref:AcrR family transcriptional regulator n=1 Tax=Amycolatopsis magusensis TaxID=882444 RepID=A0ABS4Q1B5_9PSEU|nr:TetR/AcrR family transcriptional regulator [Amycolatopsis magusensis]MBP2185383.1 AcrR family transcriptional regulator [Amycolatopsis magusensis]